MNATWHDLIMDGLLPLAVPVLLFLAWQAVAALKRRGYQTTYAEALLRAVGAGADAAHSAGSSIFKPDGRAIAVAVAVHYLQTTVGTAAGALGIVGEAAHAKRIEAQIGVIAVQAEATTNALVQAETGMALGGSGNAA